MNGRTYIVDILGRFSGLGLGCRRDAALRQQHRARAALHILRREDRLHMRFGQQVSSHKVCLGLHTAVYEGNQATEQIDNEASYPSSNRRHTLILISCIYNH